MCKLRDCVFMLLDSCVRFAILQSSLSVLRRPHKKKVKKRLKAAQPPINVEASVVAKVRGKARLKLGRRDRSGPALRVLQVLHATRSSKDRSIARPTTNMSPSKASELQEDKAAKGGKRSKT